MIETHCHLDYLKHMPMADILKQSKDTGVEKFITISVSDQNLATVLEIANNNKNVYCTQGIHPHDASCFNDQVAKQILENTKNNQKVVAIGEIGLDYHYDNSPRDVQQQAFKKQLELAVQLNKPIVIHTREAEEDTEKILAPFVNQLTRKGVFHSFTSKWELAQFALDADFYIGFNGIITFKNAQEVRDTLAKVPLNRIVLETDAPYLTPAPFRGKPNAPYYLDHIAEKIAEVKGVDKKRVIDQTTLNAQQLFQF